LLPVLVLPGFVDVCRLEYLGDVFKVRQENVLWDTVTSHLDNDLTQPALYKLLDHY